MSRAKLAWALPWRENEGNAKIEDCMNAMIISLWLMWHTGTIDQRDIFFQYKIKIDDRERLQMPLSYHRSKTKH